MTSLHHQHADAVAATLDAALWQLDAHAVMEARAIADLADAAADPIRSPTWGRRHALGGHGDPVGDAILGLGGRIRRNRYADLSREVTEQLDGVARHLPAPLGWTAPLTRIRDAIPAMTTHAAGRTTLLLDRLNGRIRRQLRIGTGLDHLAGLECPACRDRLVSAYTAAPATVICRCDHCRCTGPGCHCRLPGAVVGAPHVWVRARAVAGAIPTNTPH
ncbi:hypothetical protein [Micromonospora sp. NPDC003816]|uniref:hypothetical protein n=1 Tax=Micromonospora sp. NPDC003816 TaxID=3364224 RepID=UPI0036805A4E